MHLSIAERIQLAEDLWDSVAAEAARSPERLPVSDAQRRELLRRSVAHRQNPHEAVPLDALVTATLPLVEPTSAERRRGVDHG